MEAYIESKLEGAQSKPCRTDLHIDSFGYCLRKGSVFHRNHSSRKCLGGRKLRS